MTKLKLAKSAITDNVYVGKIKSDGKTWDGEKQDVTFDFLVAVIDRWNGYQETIEIGNKKYVVSVKETEE